MKNAKVVIWRALVSNVQALMPKTDLISRLECTYLGPTQRDTISVILMNFIRAQLQKRSTERLYPRH